MFEYNKLSSAFSEKCISWNFYGLFGQMEGSDLKPIVEGSGMRVRVSQSPLKKY